MLNTPASKIFRLVKGNHDVHETYSNGDMPIESLIKRAFDETCPVGARENGAVWQ